LNPPGAGSPNTAGVKGEIEMLDYTIHTRNDGACKAEVFDAESGSTVAESCWITHKSGDRDTAEKWALDKIAILNYQKAQEERRHGATK
jgi:hypothetical protein